MTDENTSPTPPPGQVEPAKPRELSPAARRALEEAAARRAAQEQTVPPREINGRGGPEPVRYGDWEIKGIASDF